MVSAQERTTAGKIFRIIFVLFFLYLMGDAFYRWDGVRYYASFIDFLPSVALVTILWSIVTVFTAVLVWLLIKAMEWFSLRVGWKVRTEHLLLFIIVFILLGVTTWVGKRLIWHYTPTPLTLKIAVFLCVTITAIFLSWLFRNKSEQWIGIVQERITPLVWLFGIWVVISVPIVAYHTSWKQTDNVISQRIPQSSVTDESRPNIILVTFDALSARDMSVHGYRRSTTKFIAKWAKEASLFTRLQAESNITTPTTSSIMTGKRLWTHQAYHNDGSNPVKSNIENMALVLKNSNYYNMAFIANPGASVKTLGIENSFEIAFPPSEFRTPASLFGIIDKLLYQLFGDKIRLYNWIIKDLILSRIIGFQDFSKTEVPVEKVFNRFLNIIDRNPPKPFFAWIHLLPPHMPYLPSEQFVGMFDSSSILRTNKNQRRALLSIESRYKQFPQEVQPAIDILRARYDEFIRYCDKHFEDFILQLKERGRLKNTVIILSSDHGESFEHGYITHSGKHLYEQVTHIPLIIKESDQTEGRVINDLVEQIDIPPTILELANVPVPLWMEGRSLVPLMRSKRVPPRPAFSMALQKNPSRGHKITRGTIAVWEGDYKLIHYLEEKKSLLFNLKEDPEELNNLFNKEPEVGHRLLGLIQDNLKKANERISRGR